MDHTGKNVFYDAPQPQSVGYPWNIVFLHIGIYIKSAHHWWLMSLFQDNLTDASIRCPEYFVICGLHLAIWQSGQSHGDKCGLSYPSWLSVPFSWRREERAIQKMCIWTFSLFSWFSLFAQNFKKLKRIDVETQNERPTIHRKWVGLGRSGEHPGINFVYSWHVRILLSQRSPRKPSINPLNRRSEFRDLLPKLLVVAIPIGLWRWSAQVMLPAAFSALWTCREPLELLPLGDLIWYPSWSGFMEKWQEPNQRLEPNPKSWKPHGNRVFCIRNISGPMFESTLDATHPSMNAQKHINPHGIAFTRSKVRQFWLSWIKTDVFSHVLWYDSVSKPCTPGERQNSWYMDVHPPKNGINRYWSIPISSGEVNGFIFSHFIQLDLLQAAGFMFQRSPGWNEGTCQLGMETFVEPLIYSHLFFWMPFGIHKLVWMEITIPNSWLFLYPVCGGAKAVLCYESMVLWGPYSPMIPQPAYCVFLIRCAGSRSFAESGILSGATHCWLWCLATAWVSEPCPKSRCLLLLLLLLLLLMMLMMMMMMMMMWMWGYSTGFLAQTSASKVWLQKLKSCWVQAPSRGLFHSFYQVTWQWESYICAN